MKPKFFSDKIILRMNLKFTASPRSNKSVLGLVQVFNHYANNVNHKSWRKTCRVVTAQIKIAISEGH